MLENEEADKIVDVNNEHFVCLSVQFVLRE